MNGSLEEAYVAVERAYGQGDFARALQLADALRPQIQPGRPDLLDHRLNLLIGHIHLYGLNQPDLAGAAYSAVFKDCAEPSYRELASQGLAISRQQNPAQAAAGIGAPTAAPLSAGGAQPATPWMTQLQDPQQALRQIQDVGTAVAPDAAPEAEASTAAEAAATAVDEPAVAPQSERGDLPAAPVVPEAATEPGDDRDAIIPVVVTVEEEQEEAPVEAVAEAPAESDETPEPATVADSTVPGKGGLSEEEWADFQRGLLLVDLTNTTAPPSR